MFIGNSQKRIVRNKNITIIGDSISYHVGYRNAISSMYNQGNVTIKVWAEPAGKVMLYPPYPYFGYQVVKSISDNPFLVLILLGFNDNPLNTFFPIEYERNISLLKEYHPQANIVCLQILNSNYDVLNNRDIKNSWIQSVCNNQNILCLNTDGWINPATDTSDGIHPTNSGYTKMVTQLVKYI